MPVGKAGWGCNFLRINALDPSDDQTSTDVIQGIYALADEYIDKGVVVCLTNGSYSCQHFNLVCSRTCGCQGTEHISVSVNMIPHVVLSGKMFTALIW